MEEYFGCSDTDTEKWQQKMRLAVKADGFEDFWSLWWETGWKLKCTWCGNWMHSCCAEFVYDLCDCCWRKYVKKKKGECLISNPASQTCTYCVARVKKERMIWRRYPKNKISRRASQAAVKNSS